MAASFTVRVTLDLTIDPAAWSAAYGTGTDRAAITADVRSYALNQFQQSAAADEGCVTDVQPVERARKVSN